MIMKTYSGRLQILPKNGVFVFGSNTQGVHGAGAALAALKYFGAVYGRARGLQGSSYAIVTKNLTKLSHPSVIPKVIKAQINKLYEFAVNNPTLDFYIAYDADTRLLSGYSNKEMAEMFRRQQIPDNIIFESGFNKLVREIC